MGASPGLVTTVPRRQGRLRDFWHSSIGKKIVMAITGTLGVGFVIAHMAGNLLMFSPNAPEAMREYAAGLRAYGPLLWVARFGLIGIVVLHIVAAAQLTARSRAARPSDYRVRKPQVSTWGARSMRIGGLLLALFIVFHLGDMTWGTWHPAFTHLDPYNNLRIGFTRWWAIPVYVIAAALLGLHLYHGVWSSWRTLGARRPSPRPLSRSVAVVIAIALAVGFASVPIAAALGYFGPEQTAAAPGAAPGAEQQDATTSGPASGTR
jgi:succinate dehydrogenase / fumarate reductase, cytochrome b subunit